MPCQLLGDPFVPEDSKVFQHSYSAAAKRSTTDFKFSKCLKHFKPYLPGVCNRFRFSSVRSSGHVVAECLIVSDTDIDCFFLKHTHRNLNSLTTIHQLFEAKFQVVF